MGKTQTGTLSITAIPFRSSNLSIPVTPFSPQLPLTPPASPPPRMRSPSQVARRPTIPHTVPPPKSPLNWIWQCHVCHVKYPLGATRRCLEDGHYFCSGSTLVRTKRGKNGKRTRVVKKHSPCSSEFDYQGWKAWAEWRRNDDEVRTIVGDMILREQEGDEIGSANTLGLGDEWHIKRCLEEGTSRANGSRSARTCWQTCDYPSECRWGSHLQKAKIKEQEEKATGTDPVQFTLPSSPSSHGYEATPLEDEHIGEDDVESRPSTTFDDILTSLDPPQPKASTSVPASPSTARTKEAFWNALLSASRRKSTGSSKAAKSPLVLSPIIEMDELESNGFEVRSPPPAKVREQSGDNVNMMLHSDPVAVSPSPGPSPPSSPEPPISPIAWLEPAAVSIPGLSLGTYQTAMGAGRSQQEGFSLNTGFKHLERREKKTYAGYVASLRLKRS